MRRRVAIAAVLGCMRGVLLTSGRAGLAGTDWQKCPRETVQAPGFIVATGVYNGDMMAEFTSTVTQPGVATVVLAGRLFAKKIQNRSRSVDERLGPPCSAPIRWVAPMSASRNFLDDCLFD